MAPPAESGPRAGHRPLRSIVLRWSLLLLLVAAVLALAYCKPGWIDEARDWIHRAGPWAPALYIALQASRGVTWVPGGVLTPLGGVVFGFALGFLYTWIGLMLAAAVGFALVRWLRWEWPDEGRVSATYDKLRRRAGREWGAVLLARLVPGVPFNVVSYLAGMTKLTWPAYLLATGVGLIPRMSLQVAIGAGLVSVGEAVD